MVDILQAKVPGGTKFSKILYNPDRKKEQKKSGPPQEPLLSVNNPQLQLATWIIRPLDGT